MDVHKPKPVHGLREFLGEICIVVIGVLIALSAENVVERFRWKEQADHARDSLKREIAGDAVNAWERLVVGPCLRAKLQVLVPALQETSDVWRGSPMQLNDPTDPRAPAVPRVYAAPLRFYITDAWKGVSSSEEFSHLKPSEVDSYKLIAYAASQLNLYQERESELASRLDPLSSDRNLTSQQRYDLLVDVAEIDRDAWLIDANAKTFLDAVAKMHLRFDSAAIQQQRREVLADQRAYRGTCVRSLPLNLS